MSKFLNLLWIVFLGFSLQGCSPSTEDESRSQNGPHTVLYHGDKALSELLSSAPLSCGQIGGGCPENVGMFVAIKNESDTAVEYSQCTASFVGAKDIIVTNSHCLPLQFKEGASCKGKLGFKTLSTSQAEGEIYFCEEILSFSKISVSENEEENDILQEDYAFIKLNKKTKTSVFQFKQDGVFDGAALKTIVVNPLKDREGQSVLGGVIEVKQATAVQNSLLNQKFTNNLSSSALAIGASVKKGNSGAPVLSGESSQIVGVLQGYVTKIENKYINRITEEPLPEVPSHFVMTAFTCLDFVRGLVLRPSSGCSKISNNSNQYFAEQVTTLLAQKKQQSIELEIESWLKKIPNHFEYQLKPYSQENLTYIAEPVCWKNKKRLVHKFQGELIGQLSFSNLIDSNYRLNSDLTSVSIRTRELEIRVKDGTKASSNRVQLWVTGGMLKEPKIYNIPFCSHP